MAAQDTEAALYQRTAQLLRDHESLLNDRRRNRFFFKALQRHVGGASSVLDIGAGTGLWAIAAARLGARRVVAVEMDALLLGLIKALARDNGVADRVEVVGGDSRQLQLGREFDVVISETVGHLVFDEPIVSVMLDARQRFLKPGGVLLPCGVALVAAAAHLRPRHRCLPAGLPLAFGSFEGLALNGPVVLKGRRRLPWVSAPRDLVRVDLNSVTAPPNLANLTARWERQEVRQVNAFAVWAEIEMAPGHRLTTTRTSSWSAAGYRVRPFQRDHGDLEFSLTLTGATTYWTARLRHEQGEEVQSYSPAAAATAMVAQAQTGADVFDHFRRLGLLVPG
jgi:protein arginine N-methyltransferase 1